MWLFAKTAAKPDCLIECEQIADTIRDVKSSTPLTESNQYYMEIEKVGTWFQLFSFNQHRLVLQRPLNGFQVQNKVQT